MAAADPLTLAVRENAAWCDLVCRLHRFTPDGDGRLWWSARRTPDLLPDAVTLVPDLSVLEVLGRINDSLGASVKDSFATFDLTDQGWTVLFDATWVARHRRLARTARSRPRSRSCASGSRSWPGVVPGAAQRARCQPDCDARRSRRAWPRGRCWLRGRRDRAPHGDRRHCRRRAVERLRRVGRHRRRGLAPPPRGLDRRVRARRRSRRRARCRLHGDRTAPRLAPGSHAALAIYRDRSAQASMASLRAERWRRVSRHPASASRRERAARSGRGVAGHDRCLRGAATSPPPPLSRPVTRDPTSSSTPSRQASLHSCSSVVSSLSATHGRPTGRSPDRGRKGGLGARWDGNGASPARPTWISIVTDGPTLRTERLILRRWRADGIPRPAGRLGRCLRPS